MTPFAFIIHPFEPKDAAKKYPLLRFLPDAVIEQILRHKKPMVVSEIKGIVSKTGAPTEGWFIGCPLTPEQMTRKVPIDEVYDKIVQCAELAHGLGAKLIGLGAFTSVVGDGGITIAKRSPIPVTTGNSYTVATAIEGTLYACDLLDVDRTKSTLAVVGATGSIGKTCATILAEQFERTIVIGRDVARTELVASTITNGEACISLDRLREADVIITVTSAETAVIEPEHLRQGAIICDVARPRDVSVRVAKTRKDILIIEGGVVKVPGNPEFGIDFGFPRGTAYACMSETMMLALEDRAESFTLGKDVSVEQVQETQRLAAKHGFELAGFRSFEREVGVEQIEFVRKVRRDRLSASPA